MIYFNLQNISIHTYHVISQILLRDSKLFFSVIFSAVGESCSYMKVEKKIVSKENRSKFKWVD